jgi:hypothetical protein
MIFDGVLPPHPSAPIGSPSQAWKRDSVISQAASLDIRPTSSASSDVGFEVERNDGGLRSFLRSIIGGKSRAKPAAKALDASASSPATGATPPIGKLTRSATSDSQIPRSRASAFKQPTPQASRGPSPVRHRNFCFKFSLETHLKAHHPTALRLTPPRLPLAAQLHLQADGVVEPMILAVEPVGEAKSRAMYSGRALAEWMCIVMECRGFFERRKGEGVPSNKQVETPTLGV